MIRPKPATRCCVTVWCLAAFGSGLMLLAEELVPGWTWRIPGPINGVVIQRGDKTLVVYGDPDGRVPKADTVLFTHHRRDVVWAGRELVRRGAQAVVPERERAQFTEVADFWAGFRQARFHDYAQQTTKVLTDPLPVTRTVKGGDSFLWEGLTFRVLDTPGYTRGAVTYVVELDRATIAFTGDLICGDGQLWDLYSLQDAIPEAKIGGYHGYAARLGELVSSLERLAAAKPDLIVPARGPVIRDPAEAIDRLLRRLRAFYANYLSIDALRWYFGDDQIRAKARRVLGAGAEIEWMAMAETVQTNLPGWVVPISNTRLIQASDGAGFLVDCGGTAILDDLRKRHRAGTLTSLDHLFITHYHDDHTDAVPQLVAEFDTTVYACPEMVDILERPSAYRLPAMTARPIPVSARVRNDATWRWREFELSLFFFPGQTLYHQALLVRQEGGESVCFIGDSFTPSGIDDYCLLNRNFLHPGQGYFFCLDRLRQLPPECLLINQHVGPAFRFSASQLTHIEQTLRARLDLLRELTPWDDPNFALDEGWARLRPYAVEVRPAETFSAAVIVMNHASEPQSFRARLNLPAGWPSAKLWSSQVQIPPLQEGALHFTVAVPAAASPGLRVLTADLEWGDHLLREWTEMLVEITPGANP